MKKQKFQHPIFDPVANIWRLGRHRLPISTYTNIEAQIVETEQIFSCCTINLGRDGHLGIILDTAHKTKTTTYDNDRSSTNYESFTEAQTVVKLRKQKN